MLNDLRKLLAASSQSRLVCFNIEFRFEGLDSIGRLLFGFPEAVSEREVETIKTGPSKIDISENFISLPVVLTAVVNRFSFPRWSSIP